ncbi:beta-lactamase family protein [Chitinophaga sedimenti]|uniref:serine hydrolase domain-containing protein n=1 Tax=Chitinophaga sedimenti TaxID=2033606 RepID=UPI0020031414|nr:serine hydrolase domain-containing protein [Chitinophaga sedimenti]MCK7556318.1 beta-lactamase family protein [Chitinophaga sedimenti]
MRLPLLLLCIGLQTHAQTIKRIDGSHISTAALSQQIKHLMDTAHVQGMGLTIFNNNSVVFKQTFGYKQFDTRAPLTATTNIYGASLSKAVFAVMVMKLVQQGRLELDKPLQSYLDKPIYEYPTRTKWQDHYEHFKNDTLYRLITARMCLSHTSGLPNWRWDMPDQQPRIRFQPGSRYGYSGEGMVYLQTVLERITGKSLQQLAEELVFQPLGMKNSAYQWLPAYENDYAFGHQPDGKLYEKDKDNEPRAPSTLETTLDDLTLFVQAVLQQKILNTASTKEMFRPQIPLRSQFQFGPDAWKDTTGHYHETLQLSYGLGWGLLKTPYGWGAFKEGHGDGFQHYCIIFPVKKMGILIMTNSDNGESIYKALLETAIGDKYTPRQWHRYIPYNLHAGPEITK